MAEETDLFRTLSDPTPRSERSATSDRVGLRRIASGRVKWFNAKHGFGYIVRDDDEASSEEVFVRRRGIARRNPLKRFQSLDDGEAVRFVLKRGERGWEAEDVTGPGGECVRGSRHTPASRKSRRRMIKTTSSSSRKDKDTSESMSLSSQLSSLCIAGDGSENQSSSLTSPTSPITSPYSLQSVVTTHHSLDSVLCTPTLTPPTLTPTTAQYTELKEKQTLPRHITEDGATPEEKEEGSLSCQRAVHRIPLKIQQDRSVRELSRDEVSSLLGCSKFIQRLLGSPNVVSLSYTEEVRGGKRTGRKVLQVGVVEKRKKREVRRPDIRLPSLVLLGADLAVPVQVVEEGELELLGRYSGGAQLKVRHSLSTAMGTLGARDKEMNSYRILSCAHVLTQFNPENIGRPISVAYSTGDEDYQDLGWSVGGHAEGRRSRWRKRLRLKQDLAWAYVKQTQVTSSVLNVGKVMGKRRPEIGMRVTISGGYSGTLVTGAEVVDTNASISNHKWGVEFSKLCYIDGRYGFTAGDSGSAVIDVESRALVGIFMGATKLKTYFSAVVL